ncbi:MAG: glycosyl transferase family 1 [Deltaproteobacteria bacterium]|jgi:UDP:flavonoid glycosyltransferase YjiC (YdhE family)|nr:glycosyl transferase family 1 [Deltaproteobacteria bacterium]
MRKKILFMAEAVTLAHVGRLSALAASLNPNFYDIKLLSAPGFDHLLGSLPFTKGSLASIAPKHFLKSLKAGRNPYDLKTLIGYVEEDLRQIDEFEPDLIVGDFRLSLAVSGKLRKLPTINIVNAHWSPYAHPLWTVPSHPVLSVLGPVLGQTLFNWFRPSVFSSFAAPFNLFLKHYGLEPVIDYREFYCHGDFVLYPDLPDVVPTFDRPSNHRYLGPLTWSTQTKLPDWWHQIDPQLRAVFVSLGSSGRTGLLPKLLSAMGEENLQLLVATSDKDRIAKPLANAFIADFIPADRALAVAELMICNGGSGSINQAIMAGCPLIGIAENLDQYLAMNFVEKSGFGVLLRADQVTPQLLRRTLHEVLDHSEYRSRAQEMKNIASSYSPQSRFARLVVEVFSARQNLITEAV